VHTVGNLTKIPNLWETKRIEKTHAKEKQSHAQNSIYVVRQFIYIHGVAEISLLSGKKKIQDAATIILHNKNTATLFESGRVIKALSLSLSFE